MRSIICRDKCGEPKWRLVFDYWSTASLLQPEMMKNKVELWQVVYHQLLQLFEDWLKASDFKHQNKLRGTFWIVDISSIVGRSGVSSSAIMVQMIQMHWYLEILRTFFFMNNSNVSASYAGKQRDSNVCRFCSPLGFWEHFEILSV
jgi:hypothetical protein